MPVCAPTPSCLDIQEMKGCMQRQHSRPTGCGLVVSQELALRLGLSWIYVKWLSMVVASGVTLSTQLDAEDGPRELPSFLACERFAGQAYKHPSLHYVNPAQGALCRKPTSSPRVSCSDPALWCAGHRRLPEQPGSCTGAHMLCSTTRLAWLPGAAVSVKVSGLLACLASRFRCARLEGVCEWD